MPGTHKKGTNDADGNGKKGGSLPEEPAVTAAEADEAKAPAKEKAKKPATLEDLQSQLDDMRETMRRNGWTVK